MLETLLGSSAVIAALAIQLLGEPDQIRISWKRKSTHGLSLVLYVLIFLSYCLWTAYGVVHGDFFIVAAQSIGVLTSGIVLMQFWLYRGRSENHSIDALKTSTQISPD